MSDKVTTEEDCVFWIADKDDNPVVCVTVTGVVEYRGQRIDTNDEVRAAMWDLAGFMFGEDKLQDADVPQLCCSEEPFVIGIFEPTICIEVDGCLYYRGSRVESDVKHRAAMRRLMNEFLEWDDSDES